MGIPPENPPSRDPARQKLLNLAKESPEKPGVYLMKDSSDLILYVGKAKSLKNRVSSYFMKQPHEQGRIELLIQQVVKFDVILTESETEALILEATLIKRHKPKYNIRLKDDKAYPYIKIAVADSSLPFRQFPRLEWTRKVRNDGARYFGPFPSAWSARRILASLNEFYLLRECSDNTFSHRSRPCLLYQMGKCSAPCVGLISAEEYQKDLDEVTAILEGKSRVFLDYLENKMQEHAEAEEYEKAGMTRDLIEHLKLVTLPQVADDAGSAREQDVLGLAREESHAIGVILQIRGGRLVSVKHLTLKNSDATQPDAEVLRELISQYYFNEETTGTAAPPARILVPYLPEDKAALEEALDLFILTADQETTHSREKSEQLVRIAVTNAGYGISQALKKESVLGYGALEEVSRQLHLPKIPVRIECYDISNIQGTDAVASRVVFIEGVADKNLYRRYKIKTVQGQNDFAMMKEVLMRRFSNPDEALPDLVVVDGGKGQLSQAVAIFQELELSSIPVVGLAKARTERNFQKSEVESSSERIFIPGRMNPLPLNPGSQAFRLLTQVRDEAHRFAVSYHRLLRAKTSLGRRDSK